MAQTCKWLHEAFEQLPIIRYPFDLKSLPQNGIYAFYEEGETWGHGGEKPRIVRIGTHRDGNFRSRIRDHYLVDKSEPVVTAGRPTPKDRSIFRKNLGRALLNRAGDPYLAVWDLDFTSRKHRDQLGHLRDVPKEQEIETEVTGLLREAFAFRFLAVDSQVERMGTSGLEATLIGTLSHCSECRPSEKWLGKHSPKPQIVGSGLWLVQHLNAASMSEAHRQAVLTVIQKTEGSWGQ